MSLFALGIPEETEAQARWLEEHLVGANLGALVAELEAIHGDADGRSLEQVLGNAWPAVLSQGLSSLSADQLQHLLRHPQQLLALQERILIDGGPFWSERLRSNADVMRLVEQGWTRIEAEFRSDVPAPQPAERRDSLAWYRRPILVSLATAAAMLLAMVTWQQLIPPQRAIAAWGWNRPTALNEQASASEYLTSLAAAADEWFNRRPESAVELAQRILEFRQGCSRLLLSEHKPLAPDDREWLIERCRVWAGKLDGQLTALEAGTSPVEVRKQADEIVRTLIRALRERADHAQT